VFAACHPHGDKSDDTAADSGVTDSAPEDRGTGDLSGTVSVQLYTQDEDGENVDLSWEDYGGDFPFGAIYVAAYTVDDTTGEYTYYDESVISAPSTEGDPYTLSVDVDDAEEVRVYAALDWWADGVIGTTEPVGIYAGLVPIEEGGTTEGVDIVINAPELPTGGGGGSVVTLSGGVTIDTEYTGGDVKVTLYDNAGDGPYYVSYLTPTATADGAEGDFSLVVGSEFGEGRLIGAWDDDQNALIDPTDRWGGYVVADESANPITVGATDQDAYTVVIPFGIPPVFTPYVRLDGTLSYADDLGTLPAGAIVYVAALRTRPNADFSVADLDHAYDWISYTGAELTGTELDYTLLTPSNAITYLWGYADLDGDGLLNEVGEPVASYGPTGRYSTGTTDGSGLDMPLQTVSE
jgi:hypothetical protein